MTLLEIIDFIVIILCCVTYGVMMYFKVKGNVLEAVSELIAEVEKSGLSGSEKMANVVSGLYDLVPNALQKWLTKDKLQKIAQTIFNWMRKYADNYITAKQESTVDEQTKKLYAENAETTAQIVVELMNMTASKLMETASDNGIEISEEDDRDTVIRKIVIAELTKV